MRIYLSKWFSAKVIDEYWLIIESPSFKKKKRHYQLKTLIKGFDASSKSLVIGFVSKMLPVGGKNVAND